MIVIHVDMDAFYASVEVRDDPALAGKPLIIGALPSERGVVATCSYEARRYGVHSAMNIKEAYRLCPQGIYRHPDFDKYKRVSAQLHEIWDSYASASETIALDEAYLDVTARVGSFEGARTIGQLIKKRTREELGLTCSVGVAYSKTAAKTASEEKKPDGYFEIPTAEDFVRLIIDRDVRVLYTVGEKTAQKLYRYGIHTVRDLQEHSQEVKSLLGKQGEMLCRISLGIDERPVVPYRPEDAQSVGREITFQEDVEDLALLKEVLLLLSLCVEERARRHHLYGRTVTLKLTFGDMKSITRSRGVFSTHDAAVLYQESCHLLELVDPKPVRLIGVSLHNLTGEEGRQLSLDDLLGETRQSRQTLIQEGLRALGEHYRLDFAGNLEKITHGEVLHKTVEYM